MSLFTAVKMAPRDPILGLNEQFNADTNPAKVNLGVGVYFDDNGKLPLLQCVQAAEKAMMATPSPRGYLPIDGIAAYDAAVKSLVFGADSEPVTSGRVATVQGIGASRSNIVAGLIVVKAGYSAAFLTLAAVALAAFATFLVAMPETRKPPKYADRVAPPTLAGARTGHVAAAS